MLQREPTKRSGIVAGRSVLTLTTVVNDNFESTSLSRQGHF